MINFSINEKITTEEFIIILNKSGLAERRPINNVDVIKKMIDNANLILTARDEDGILVGIARCLTDYAYCCYLSCLAVDRAYQRRGIGNKMISKILETIGDDSNLLLLSAPGNDEFYIHSGFQRMENAYGIKRHSHHTFRKFSEKGEA